jgi:hypothetical protein
MIRLILLVPFVAAGCVVYQPAVDRRLVIVNGSDQTVFVRLNYREPDAGRVEKMYRLFPHHEAMPWLFEDSWESLIRRVGQLTIDFCDEVDRETIRQVVVSESDLRSAAWRVAYSKP